MFIQITSPTTPAYQSGERAHGVRYSNDQEAVASIVPLWGSRGLVSEVFLKLRSY